MNSSEPPSDEELDELTSAGSDLGVGTGLIVAADRTVTGVCSIAVAIPEFWLGMLLILLFAVVFKALPSSGYVGPTTSIVLWLRHIILPAFSLSVVPAATTRRPSCLARMTAAALPGGTA